MVFIDYLVLVDKPNVVGECCNLDTALTLGLLEDGNRLLVHLDGLICVTLQDTRHGKTNPRPTYFYPPSRRGEMERYK